VAGQEAASLESPLSAQPSPTDHVVKGVDPDRPRGRLNLGRHVGFAIARPTSVRSPDPSGPVVDLNARGLEGFRGARRLDPPLPELLESSEADALSRTMERELIESNIAAWPLRATSDTVDPFRVLRVVLEPPCPRGIGHRAAPMGRPVGEPNWPCLTRTSIARKRMLQ